MTTASAMNHITAQDVDTLLEVELASHDPAAPARLFTVLQRLLTLTAQQTSKNVVYLHRGINPTKRVFFQALCAALGGHTSSYRSGCGWVTSENIDAAAQILNHGSEGRYPQLLVLDNIPSGTLIEWRHLMSLAATPAVQIHVLQDIAWPHEHLKLPTASVEQYDWRDLSSSAVSLRADAVDVLAPAIASWLGIVGAAHPADIAGLCAAPGEVYLTASHLADVPPSARSPRRPLLSATPALWSPGGACANATLLPTEPERTSRVTPQIAPCRKDPCVAPARSSPPALHVGCGKMTIGCDALCDEAHGEPSVSSSAVTAPVAPPSSVSPSAATWPQESAATATQPDSTQSSAETVKPVGDEPTKKSFGPDDFITISLPGPLAVMQARAAQTAIYPGAGTGDRDARLYTALSLAGEAGEVAGKASKVMRDGESSALMAALYTELGDVFWHWLQCCQEWGAQPDQVAEAMFQRLQDRRRRGTLQGSGDER